MICSAVNFFPRGIDRPPSFVTTTRFLLQLWSRLKGARQFTGGIGEHAAEIRQRVCKLASWLGIELKPEVKQDGDFLLSTDMSRISVWVILTDEELMIAGHTSATLAHAI
jgi:acetate kinase